MDGPQPASAAHSAPQTSPRRRRMPARPGTTQSPEKQSASARRPRARPRLTSRSRHRRFGPFPKEDRMRSPFTAVVVVAAALAVAVPAGAADVVATVGGQQITRTQLEDHVKAKLVEIESERYQALHDGLDDMIADELFKQEAKAR